MSLEPPVPLPVPPVVPDHWPWSSRPCSRELVSPPRRRSSSLRLLPRPWSPLRCCVMPRTSLPFRAYWLDLHPPATSEAIGSLIGRAPVEFLARACYVRQATRGAGRLHSSRPCNPERRCACPSATTRS